MGAVTVVMSPADNAAPALRVETRPYHDVDDSPAQVMARYVGEADALNTALKATLPAATVDSLFALMAADRVGRHHVQVPRVDTVRLEVDGDGFPDIFTTEAPTVGRRDIHEGER